MTSDGSADLRLYRGCADQKPAPPQVDTCLTPPRRSALPQSRTLAVGLDGQQASIAGASVAQDHGAEGISLGTIGTRHGDLDPRVRTRPSKAKRLVLVYEAGPCGDWRDRSLMSTGSDGWGVAPSLLPHKAGARVNTDRRDAVPRARLARSGALTPVAGPTRADEALRDLTRARAEPRSELTAAKVRLQAFWLRPDSRSMGRATWGPAHLRWLSAGVCATPAHHLVCQAYVRAVNAHPARRQRLEPARHAQGTAWRLDPVVEALQALRGGQCTVAASMVAELGDLPRCDTPRALMHFLGLLPSASSTGERRRPGAMTNAGNTQARRALGEGAWA